MFCTVLSVFVNKKHPERLALMAPMTGTFFRKNSQLASCTFLGSALSQLTADLIKTGGEQRGDDGAAAGAVTAKSHSQLFCATLWIKINN